MEYWQVGAGEGDRDYSGVFLRFGVVFGGNANRGPYDNDPDYYDENFYVVYFRKMMSIGDRVILKRPHGTRWEIVAVGKIISDYEYFHALDDMDGWNVAHGRRVKWVVPPQRRFVNGLAQGTVLKVHNKNVIKKAEMVLQSGTPKPAKKIPRPPKDLRDEEIVEELINHGFKRSNVKNLKKAIRRVQSLAEWYLEHEHGKDVHEHETRTFLIVPLLLGLGWSEQQLKIEWKNIDIAFFKRPHTEDDKDNPCIMILESKKLEEGLAYAKEQAIDYAKSFPRCHRLIISNGICYKLYTLDRDNWKYKSYLNILKPRSKHPYERQVSGAIEVFLNLMSRSFEFQRVEPEDE